MAATSTLKQILEQLATETGMGAILPAYTGTTTTLTATTSYGAGPFTGSKFPIGSPVIITSTTGLGEKTFVAGYNPIIGVITVSPAITTASSSAIVFDKDFEHADRITDAVNRAQNKVARWQLMPLTFVPDGDMNAATVDAFWRDTGSASVAYATVPAFPAVANADAVGTVGMARQVVQGTTSGGGGTVSSNGILAPVSAQLRSWFFRTAIRLVSGTGTASFGVYDDTNGSVPITLQVKRGNDSGTLTTTTFGDFMVCEGTLQLPATCAEFTARLVLSADSMVAQMAPVIMYPLGALSFPLPNRITSDDDIGNFYPTRTGGPSPSTLADISLGEPYTVGGITHTITDYGDHRTVTFNIAPHCPLWYDELYSEPALTTLTGTTTFPLDYVVKWAKFELFKFLYQKERAKRARLDSGSPTPSVWRTATKESLIEAENCNYEPRLMKVYGRT